MQTLTAKLYTQQQSRTGSIMERIKTFEDACKELGIYPSEINISVEGNMSDDMKAIAAYTKLIIISRALNEGWAPDWTNKSQYKYYPWFDMSSPSGPAFHVYDYWSSVSLVGSRLCYKSRELAEYAGKQFIDIYADFLSL